ncbi:hypothetical protein BRC19_00315 [Candidatus Saccharibacteria bacterium QS_5_54_17]|nr:MAG: hypothetical protein BRC19_00315 [Candidatus Saccharibacteria bacterium QS_5_54_17]
MPKTYTPVLLGAGALIALGLIASLLVTSPDQLGPFGITIWFALLLLVTAAALTWLIYRRRKEYNRAGFMHASRRGFLIALWAVSLLALNSLRQLAITDIILITVLVVVIDFYMRRTLAS